ncbi:MAG: transposase [Bradymonadales bacterium]|nr:transposase [Bradymonadales bacterium]
MMYDPDRHHRRSIRLRGYDYSQAGAYFVTMCVQGRACLFGAVVDGEMRWNDVGKMIEHWWLELNAKFPGVETDEYAVMPNHFHGIVVIVGTEQGPPGEGPTGPAVPTIVQWFKTMTTNAYLRGVKTSGWTPFPWKLWQRNYYEHIIRDDDDLHRIRQYILDNPSQWDLDRENPNVT